MKISLSSIASKLNPKARSKKKAKPSAAATTPRAASFASSTASDDASTSTPRSVLTPPPAFTRQELEAVVLRLGVADDHADSVSAALDDVVAAMDAGCCTEEDLRDAFGVFDADGDGRISAEELLGVLTGVVGDEGCTLDDCRRMIGGVDSDGDGFVCFRDFVRMMDPAAAA